MRKTTEELWNEAVDVTPGSDDVHETFRRLVIENERECAEPATAWCAIDEGGAHLRWNKDDHHDWHPLFTFPPASQVPEGWRLVPIEPTYEMLVAMSGEWHSSRHKPDVYKAMLAAAPEVK